MEIIKELQRKYQDGTTGLFTYIKTKKGILRISVFETVDGWAKMEEEYITEEEYKTATK